MQSLVGGTMTAPRNVTRSHERRFQTKADTESCARDQGIRNLECASGTGWPPYPGELGVFVTRPFS